MNSVEVNGATLQLTQQGDGAPAVLVHGSAGDYRTWNLQLNSFASVFRTVAYSRRYHYPNRPITPGAEYSLDEHVRDLISLLTALDAAPAHLVGHSYGAVVCLVVALREPELVRSLVLAEPPVISLFVSVPPRPMEIATSALARPITTLGIVKLGALGLGPATNAARKGDTEAMVRLTGRAILGPSSYEALSSERLQQVRDNTIPEELLSSSFLPRLSQDDVAAVRTPVLLVGGSHSPFVFGRLLGELDRLLPNARRILIQQASHLMHEDNPSQYNDDVVGFLVAHA